MEPSTTEPEGVESPSPSTQSGGSSSSLPSTPMELSDIAQNSSKFSIDFPVCLQEHENEEEKVEVFAEARDNVFQIPLIQNQPSNLAELSSSEQNACPKPEPLCKATIPVKIPKSHSRYNLQPKIIGPNEGGKQKIFFEDAQDNSFYLERKLKNPELTIWILVWGTKKLGYSSKRLVEAGWKRNFEVRLMQGSQFDIVLSQEGMESLFYCGQKIEKYPDAILPRFGWTIDYSSLALVRFLENHRTLVLNTHDALSISKDKLHTLEKLACCGLPVPKTMIAKFPHSVSASLWNSGFSGDSENQGAYDYVTREFKFPILLKKVGAPHGQKGSVKIDNKQQLLDICDLVVAQDIKNTPPMIFQEFISSSAGKSIIVFVVGSKAVGAMTCTATDKESFKVDLPSAKCKRMELSSNPAVEYLAIEAAKHLGLEVAEIEILIGEKQNFIISEVNSNADLMPFECATGIDLADQILDYAYVKSGFWKNQKPSKQERSALFVFAPLLEHIGAPNKKE